MKYLFAFLLFLSTVSLACAQQLGDLPTAASGLGDSDITVIVQGYTGSSGTGHTYKTTLGAIKTYIGSSSYTLIPATTTTLGGVKVPNAGGLAVDGSGNLSISVVPWATITGAPTFLTANQTITLSSDVTGAGSTGIAATVKGLNGHLLSSMNSGILYNTTTTGNVTIATQNQIANQLSGTTGNLDLSGATLTLPAATIALFELALGNPAGDGYVLSSTTSGARSWIAPTPAIVIGSNASVFLTYTTGTLDTPYSFNSDSLNILQSPPDASGGFLSYNGNPNLVIAGLADGGTNPGYVLTENSDGTVSYQPGGVTWPLVSPSGEISIGDASGTAASIGIDGQFSFQSGDYFSSTDGTGNFVTLKAHNYYQLQFVDLDSSGEWHVGPYWPGGSQPFAFYNTTNGGTPFFINNDGSIGVETDIVAGGVASFCSGQALIQAGGAVDFADGQFTSDASGNVNAYSLTNNFTFSSDGTLFHSDGGGNVTVNSLNVNGNIALNSDGTAGFVGAVSASNFSGSGSTLTGLPKQIYAGAFSGSGTATTSFVVTIGTTQASTNYSASISPTNALSSAVWYISAKTTTTFTVTYLTGLTGSVAFDWTVTPQ